MPRDKGGGGGGRSGRGNKMKLDMRKGRNYVLHDYYYTQQTKLVVEKKDSKQQNVISGDKGIRQEELLLM